MTESYSQTITGADIKDFSALFGTKLRFEGCVYVAENLQFKRPVYIDDTVTEIIIVTVTAELHISESRYEVDFLRLKGGGRTI